MITLNEDVMIDDRFSVNSMTDNLDIDDISLLFADENVIYNAALAANDFPFTEDEIDRLLNEELPINW